MARRNGTGQGESPERQKAGKAPTIKQQRVDKRAAKVAAMRSQQAKASRNRRITLGVGGVAALLVIALLVFIANSGGSSAAIAGVQTFPGLAADHVNGPVNYQQTPPVGGPHSAVLLNCAKYADPVPNENAVHSLEHGAVWITYDPAVISGDQLTKLQKIIPKTYVILSPYKGIPSPIVASAWGAQLKVSRADDPRIAQFIAKYRESKSAPEPGALCTGGLDGPGKLS